MKKFYGILLLVVALAASACLKKVEHNPSENKETAFGYIMQSYAKGTGTAGFKTLADNAVTLADNAVIFANNCYLTAFNPEEISENDVKTLCSNWKTCRESWLRCLSLPVFDDGDSEVYEALGTWPSDIQGIQGTLERMKNGEEVNFASLPNNQKGFAAAEYMLFQISEGKPVEHSPDYSAEELAYLCALTEEIEVLCTFLYAKWEGMESLADSYSSLLSRHEITVKGKGYGWELVNPGYEDSRFATYQDGLLALLDGCIDFTEHFAAEMLGEEISPLSLNSITDFKSALSGINYCYVGKISNQASVSTFTKAWNPELDTQIKSSITQIQSGIGKLSEPLADCTEDIEALVKMTSTDLTSALVDVHEFIAGL